MMLLEGFAKLMNVEMVLIDMQDKNLGCVANPPCSYGD